MNKEEINKKIQFIDEYSKAENAATGSKVDANANVEQKNLATLSTEMYKEETIQLNRQLLYNKILELYGEDTAKEYIRQLKEHELYKHDESSLLPYCVAISMYPFLFHGLTKLGGHSLAPTNIDSFSGTFINLVFLVASQFAGAIATGEYLLYLDYFIRKEYGEEYYNELGTVVKKTLRKEYTIQKTIEDSFQQVVYTINQPAAARGNQAVFWNISYFDKNYFEGMFKDFVFPDGSKPQWESLKALQKLFMKWFNKERTISALTFPVETMCLLSDTKGNFLDEEVFDLAAEMYSEGHSFFTYISDSVDSLSSCCRLRNEITDNTFSYSLGAGGIATGSKSVMTLNVNRFVQNLKHKEDLVKELEIQIEKIHKYQISFNEIMKEHFKNGLLPVFTEGLISLEKQYLTIGLNGLPEAAEFLGISISDNEEYEAFVRTVTDTIGAINKKAKTKELMFNTEFVPAENLGVKFAKWDKRDGYKVPRECYNSYFYVVEDNIDLFEKIRLHGKRFIEKLDGGSALHANLEEHLTKDQYKAVLKEAAIHGCNYLTFNIPNTICNDCENIDKRKLDKCPKCGSANIDYLTRVIGYLKRIKSFSKARQTEASKRFYWKGKND